MNNSIQSLSTLTPDTKIVRLKAGLLFTPKQKLMHK